MTDILTASDVDYLNRLAALIAATTGHGLIVVRIKNGHASICTAALNVELPHDGKPGSEIPDIEEILEIIKTP